MFTPWSIVGLVAIVVVLTTGIPLFKPTNQTVYQIPEGKALRCELVEKSP
jgi:hypothetical protein